MNSKRMQALANNEELFFEDGSGWQRATREPETVFLNGEYIHTGNWYYTLACGSSMMPPDYTVVFDTLEEIRHEMGDLRSWRASSENA